MQIQKSTVAFLKEIRKNNNRPWLEGHKPEFTKAKENFKDFVLALDGEMEKHDHIEKSKIYRIYRDVRFSKDKTPYKTNLGAGFTRATNALRGGYYMQIEPEGAFVGGGFWAPNSQDLKRIRDEFVADDSYMRKIIADKNFLKYFGTLDGDGVKTAPRGYDKEHPALDLIRKKQFIVSRTFTQKEMLSKDFYQEVNETFKAMRPFFDYMSDILTTNINGESVL